ncbi:MAG: (d)CMP kinase [Rhodospirillales bacterium]|nr:(d)CMP kinase [Rhodospirillales bacterium]
MIIAVDGPAASGKGELTQRLAKHFNYARLDTGKLYRAVGWRVISVGGDPSDETTATRAAKGLTANDLEAPELRSEIVAEAASKVAAIAAVRAVLVEFQRAFAANPPDGKSGAVIDGRDIGTTICPDAPCKIFLTADIEVRAERRVNQLHEQGTVAIYGRVLKDMKERDSRDTTRSVAPLEPAEDALVLDTSKMNADAVFTAALEFIASRTSD